MNRKLTFKEYLESKEKLREAVRKTPRRVAEYNVRKYCKMVVGESKEQKEYISLKPKQKVLVEWLYTSTDNPEIVNIKFEDVGGIDPDELYETFWNGERFQKWLARNTTERK